LGAWHEDLVLVGGLVPKYLCGDVAASRELPRPVTLDADIDIAIGASVGQYGRLLDHLSAQGFELTKDEMGASRFKKQIDDIRFYLDFLTEDARGTTGTVMVDSIPANILPGINRALATARTMAVEAVDLYGATQNLTIRVCEVGPFLVLKLRAFASRQQPKDAFDLLYTLRHYDGGIDAAFAAFAAEATAGNPAIPDAMNCLKIHFSHEQATAPVRAAHFVFGQQQAGESDEPRLRRLQVQQDMVDAGRLLLEACS